MSYDKWTKRNKFLSVSRKQFIGLVADFQAAAYSAFGTDTRLHINLMQRSKDFLIDQNFDSQVYGAILN
ncbi:MAG: hypothetical protein WCD70_07215, partial [Alphaproteobacteria bacterium]